MRTLLSTLALAGATALAVVSGAAALTSPARFSVAPVTVMPAAPAHALRAAPAWWASVGDVKAFLSGSTSLTRPEVTYLGTRYQVKHWSGIAGMGRAHIGSNGALEYRSFTVTFSGAPAIDPYDPANIFLPFPPRTLRFYATLEALPDFALSFAGIREG